MLPRAIRSIRRAATLALLTACGPADRTAFPPRSEPVAALKAASAPAVTELPCTVDGEIVTIDILSATDSRAPRRGEIVEIESFTIAWPGGRCELVRDGDALHRWVGGKRQLLALSGLRLLRFERWPSYAPLTTPSSKKMREWLARNPGTVIFPQR